MMMSDGDFLSRHHTQQPHLPALLEQLHLSDLRFQLRGESFPSLPNMLVLGELFQVPLETLLIREDGSPAYHRIFDGGFPYHIGLLFQEKDDFSSKRRSKARSDLFMGNYYTKAFTHSQEHPNPEVPHN